MNKTPLRNGAPLSSVFRDPFPLTKKFFPKTIIHRDRQITQINYQLSGFTRYGMLTNNLIICGHPGTGKTHGVEYVLKNLERDLHVFTGKAYRYNSAHAFFRSFLKNNFRMKLHPRESLSVYYQAFDPDGHFKIPHLWPGQNPPATA